MRMSPVLGLTISAFLFPAAPDWPECINGIIHMKVAKNYILSLPVMPSRHSGGQAVNETGGQADRLRIIYFFSGYYAKIYRYKYFIKI